MTCDSYFQSKLEPNDDGIEVGVTKADLVRSVQIWSFANNGHGTVGDAAQVFNVTPQFLAQCIREQGNPYFFISEDAGIPETMTLEHDGY